MRILVVGAGSIGGYFGARLIAAGRDVTFMVRARRAAQLREKGLAVISPLGNLDLPAPQLVSSGSIEGVYDLIILGIKAYDAIAAANGFTPREIAISAGRSILTTPCSSFTASMLRDIESGARVEADHIVGDLLARAPKTLPTPLLATAYAHLRAHEARRARTSLP